MQVWTFKPTSGYALKTAYRDGTTHIVLEPLDLMARLAALVPPPKDAPEEVSWGVHATQQVARGGDASASGRGWQSRSSRSRQTHHTASGSHELRAAPEA